MAIYRVNVDDRPYDVDIEDEGPGRCRVTVNGRVFSVALDDGAEGGGEAALPRSEPTRSGSSSPIPTASSRPAAPPRAAASAGGATLLRAPMPGVILRVSVAPGAQVQRGQDVAVLEAMKMENLVRAPQAGTVVEVFVSPGEQVAHGAPIVRFAAAPGDRA